MFYEEKLINGVLCFRSTPDGEWREAKPAAWMPCAEVLMRDANSAIFATQKRFGPNDVFYTAEQLQAAVAAERERCVAAAKRHQWDAEKECARQDFKGAQEAYENACQNIALAINNGFDFRSTRKEG